MFPLALATLLLLSASASPPPHPDISDGFSALADQLDELKQEVSGVEERLTLRLDNIDSHFDVNGVDRKTAACLQTVIGQVVIEPYPEMTDADPDPEVVSERVCADKYGSRLAEIRSQAELDAFRVYLGATLGDTKSGGTKEIRVGLRSTVAEHGLIRLDGGSRPHFRGPRCTVISDHTMPGDDPNTRVWRLYAKKCSLRANSGVLCLV